MIFFKIYYVNHRYLGVIEPIDLKKTNEKTNYDKKSMLSKQNNRLIRNFDYRNLPLKKSSFQSDGNFASNDQEFDNRPKTDYQSELNRLRTYCYNITILSSPLQRKLCKQNIKIIKIAAKAASLAIAECQHQFKFKRWNCTTFNRTNVYGNIIHSSKKERE